MKKVTIIASLLCFGICNAQFSYGPKVGAVLTTIKAGETTAIDPENKLSYSIGAFSEYKFSNFSANIGLSYSELGSKGKTTGSADINVKENTFIIDLTANYYLMEDLSIGAGGYYGIISSTDHKISGYGNIDMSDKYETNDMGIVFRVNFDIYKGIFAEAKYNLGLSNVYKRSDVWDTLPPGLKEYDTVKNRFFTFNIGYRFL